MKRISPWTSMVAALVFAASASCPGNTQNTQSGSLPLRHFSPQAISAADAAIIQTHESDLAEAARIYGYKFELGDWRYEQTSCAPMLGTILMHYFQYYPDGTQSLFTALIPRGEGQVRIVPVLYHNATPYIAAPRNPHNYELFNQLVSLSPKSRDWLQLSACYAELTGGFANVSPGPNSDIGIAVAPSATVRLNQHDSSAIVSFAERDGQRNFRIWKISFRSDGRVASASSQERSVITMRGAPSAQFSATAQAPQPIQDDERKAQSEPIRPSPQTAAKPANEKILAQATVQMPSDSSERTNPPRVSPATGDRQSEVGWKYIPDPAQPPSKIIPQASPPTEKMRPTSSDESNQSSSGDQPQQ